MIQNISILLAQAAPAAGSEGQAHPLSSFVPLIALLVIFYFLIIRPQQKRQREHNAVIAAAKTGDEVVMNSGIHGIISNVKEKTVIVKVADNVKIEFDKAAIAQIVKDDAVKS